MSCISFFFFYCVKDSTIRMGMVKLLVYKFSIALSFLFLIQSTDDVDGTLVSKCTGRYYLSAVV